jgi:hypothetical protein
MCRSRGFDDPAAAALRLPANAAVERDVPHGIKVPPCTSTELPELGTSKSSMVGRVMMTE